MYAYCLGFVVSLTIPASVYGRQARLLDRRSIGRSPKPARTGVNDSYEGRIRG